MRCFQRLVGRDHVINEKEKDRTRRALGTLRKSSQHCEKRAYDRMGLDSYQDQQDLQGSVSGAVNSESALRSAGTILSRP
ncbi:hypothetical protein PoB_001933800 [Plakobranchus ocellatus]|uniref:Uncharacterized protein n=1 Tax=Plakobranchus ocellatus TaxID=259542 RepID=A0AAV3ZE15_9GAST|nr:hypothetical protein PoB_001933800 [Plakobranchus ocellatus]